MNTTIIINTKKDVVVDIIMNIIMKMKNMNVVVDIIMMKNMNAVVMRNIMKKVVNTIITTIMKVKNMNAVVEIIMNTIIMKENVLVDIITMMPMKYLFLGGLKLLDHLLMKNLILS